MIEKKLVLSNEIKATWAFVERQFNLSKRYLGWEIVFLFYTLVNTLTIGLIAVGMGQANKNIGEREVIFLILGAEICCLVFLIHF